MNRWQLPAYARRVWEAVVDCVPWIIIRGGRGGAKSWTVAFMVLLVGSRRRIEAVCIREHETTLIESMHRLMEILIESIPSFQRRYKVLHNQIRGTNGTRIRFRGLSESTGTARGVKGLEGVDFVVLEQAECLSAGALKDLTPTIRKADAVIFGIYNQRLPDDAIHVRAEDPDPGWLVMDVSWKDNPFASDRFHAERRYIKRTDPDAYEHIYGGALDLDYGGLKPLLDHAQVEAAAARYATPSADAPIDAGFDIADEGPDRCSVCLRTGPVLGPWDTWSGVGSDITVSTERAVLWALDHGATRFVYDAGGMGAGVRAALNGIDGHGLEVLGVNFGERVAGPKVEYLEGRSNRESFGNRGDQLGWWLRMLATGGRLALRPDTPPRIRKQLVQPRWEDRSGKIRVQKAPKGAKSPDGFDAARLALAFDTLDGISVERQSGWEMLAEMVA